MVLDLLEYNFTGLSPGDFILTMLTIAGKVEVHPDLQVLPEHVSGGPRIRELVEIYKNAQDAASGGDKGMVAAKLAAREECQTAATILAFHIAMVSVFKKDPTVLHNTGYEIKQRATYSRNIVIPPMPRKFEVKYGTFSGSAILIVGKEQGVASIDLEVSEETPPTESSFRPREPLFKCRNEVTGYEPTKRYHFPSP